MPSPSSHLRRVAGKVAPLIARFFAGLGVGARFHLYQLEEHVTKWSNATPGSAARVMRAMKRAKAIGYRLVSRTGSEYEVTKAPTDDGDAGGTGTLPGLE